MNSLVRFLLVKPIIWLVHRFSAHPVRQRVFSSLSTLYQDIQVNARKGPVIPFNTHEHRFIIFSDQHKGAKDGADDFQLSEPNYVAALQHYEKQGFHFINLGDGEELWENSIAQIRKFNRSSFDAERKFISRNGFTKIFGNHDLYWDNDPLASFHLKNLYGQELKVCEGVLLQTEIEGKQLSIFCTHGHQGDRQSDGNWLSKFFVAKIWGPLQSYLRINPNTPSCNDELKTAHNQMMYEWSSQQKNILLITGHTHQPVFMSLTHGERLARQLTDARAANNLIAVKVLETEIGLREIRNAPFNQVSPTYFNSGCCCFNDGDITGIEIENGNIRLIKWEEQNGLSARIVLQEAKLKDLV